MNIWSIVARSISQKPPTDVPLTAMCGAMKKRYPRSSIVPPEDHVGDRRVEVRAQVAAGNDQDVSHVSAPSALAAFSSLVVRCDSSRRLRPRRLSSSSSSSSDAGGRQLAVAALVADRQAAEDVFEGLRVAVQLEQDPALVDHELEELRAAGRCSCSLDELERVGAARRSAARSASSRLRPCRARPRPRPASAARRGRGTAGRRPTPGSDTT